MSYFPPPEEPLHKRWWIRTILIGLLCLCILFLVFSKSWHLNGISLGPFSFGPSGAVSTNETSTIASLPDEATSASQQKESVPEIVNYYLASSSPSEDPFKKVETEIALLRPDQTIDYFEAQLGPIYTTNPSPWIDLDSSPVQMYQEYVFKGSLSDTSSDPYYIQAITQEGNPDVVFWSMTICDPSTPFAITDPFSGKTIILNQSTFADIIKISDSPTGDEDQEAPTLHYALQGLNNNIYETEEGVGMDRLYVGVNNSCSIDNQSFFDFRNSSGTPDLTPQFLQSVSSTPGLASFRDNTKINIFGMSGGDDDSFYWFLEEKGGQASMGYNLFTSPDYGD